MQNNSEKNKVQKMIEKEYALCQSVHERFAQLGLQPCLNRLHNVCVDRFVHVFYDKTGLEFIVSPNQITAELFKV